MIAVWVFTESACSWADSWGTGGAAQKWWMLCLPWLSACSVGRGGEGEGREGRGRGRESGRGRTEKIPRDSLTVHHAKNIDHAWCPEPLTSS